MTTEYTGYFLAVLLASYFIFSLRIKKELRATKENLKSEIENYKRGLTKKLKEDKFKQAKDTLDTHRVIFENSTKKMERYINHTFYFLFSITAFGLVGGFINGFKELTLPDYTPLILAIIVLYLVLRSIFSLICYNKIDDDRFFENLRAKMEGRVKLKMLYQDIYPKDKNEYKIKRMFFWLLFNCFLMFNKNFRTYFYKLYQ
ncbi:MAG: hypothetical protein KJ955_07225 [Nanoarchaeota archaeon]|nr:hypothetical protein [Nanoarchaeota archaeon]